MVGPHCDKCQKRYWDCKCEKKNMMDDEYPVDRHFYQQALELEAAMKAETPDYINKPPHYTNEDGFPQVIDILERWFPKEPLLWQVGKYIARWDRKDTALENLKKARYYLNRKIKQLDPKDTGQ